MDDVYNNINDYNLNRNRKILIVFDNMIADFMTNKKFRAIIKELFIRCRKKYMSLVFITRSYFSVPKEVLLNSTHYLIMKIHSKRELQQIIIYSKLMSLITQQILFVKILWRFTENVQVNHVFFWLLILHYQVIIF